MRWFCDIIGYPASAGGFLTTGGSLANFSAIFTARRERLPEDFLAGSLYTSSQTHHSVQKAALLAGFPAHNVREIPTDEQFRIRLDVLQHHIEADRQAGLTPFLIIGNAGTTNTGAVDDLTALADIAHQHGLWLHVDAAYGGFFMLTQRGRARLGGIERADSVTLDPHKGLFLPFGTGSLLVREREALKRAHQGEAAAYLPTMQDDPDCVDFCQISPELSRDFRGLRVWLPLKMHGIQPFRQALDEKLDLAAWATAELKKIPEVEIVAEPQLSIVAFRLNRPGLDTSTQRTEPHLASGHQYPQTGPVDRHDARRPVCHPYLCVMFSDPPRSSGDVPGRYSGGVPSGGKRISRSRTLALGLTQT